ncbi:MAG: nucleotidyltransferase domain-containing protein [Xanthomonadales bacterium]|nr:nucleotidyltransferase domain-containing protein [Xanthomonadales bacterium]
MSFDTIATALARHPALELAIVFGSVARGQARSDSDIDIAVQADHPLSADDKIRLIEDLAMATGRPVDLIDLATVGAPLLGEILRDGKRIIGRNHDLAELALRNIYLNEDFMPYVQRALHARNHQWLQ